MEASSVPEHDIYVYLHIGKTAGSAVRNAVATQFSSEEICPWPFYHRILTLPASERRQYRLYCAHVGYRQAVELGNRLFTLLRDPVDRVLSLYFYWRSVEAETGGPGLAKRLELEEFLESRAGAIVTDVYNTQTWQLAFSHDGYTRREIRQRLDADQIFAQAIENLEKLDVVGVLERPDLFRESLRERFGWTLPDFERLNVTTARTQRNEIPIRIRRKIHEKVGMDIELYAHVLRHYINAR